MHCKVYVLYVIILEHFIESPDSICPPQLCIIVIMISKRIPVVAVVVEHGDLLLLLLPVVPAEPRSLHRLLVKAGHAAASRTRQPLETVELVVRDLDIDIM